jgi:peptide/nickel transport system ATP-binding protein
MKKGKVVEMGPAGEIFSAPKHAYTQELFAAAPGRDMLDGLKARQASTRPAA